MLNKSYINPALKTLLSQSEITKMHISSYLVYSFVIHKNISIVSLLTGPVAGSVDEAICICG